MKTEYDNELNTKINEGQQYPKTGRCLQGLLLHLIPFPLVTVKISFSNDTSLELKKWSFCSWGNFDFKNSLFSLEPTVVKISQP